MRMNAPVKSGPTLVGTRLPFAVYFCYVTTTFIHSDIYEMNDVLIEGGQIYFMTMIDDVSRYYYVYLLKMTDEALDCIKIYMDEVENQL
jgi:hypothetical protein